MATVTFEVGTADTGNTPNTSGAFTPAVDDLLVVFVVATDTTDSGPTLSHTLGTTFTFFQLVGFGGGAHRIYAFVANSLQSSATSGTVTVNCPSDTASGTIIFVFAVAGMSRTGTDAIRQDAEQANQGAGTTPAPAFAVSALTDNVTLGVVGNSTNPAGLTPPTDWTESSDLGYATPTTGGEVVFRDSGFTGTTITWGSTSASAFGDIIVELDTSVPAVVKHNLLLLGAGR